MKLVEQQFNQIRVLVVGDVMLDRYWFGKVDRISPEAPVPVLAVSEQRARAGGAANVTHNLVALGAQSHLLSVIGDDEAGSELRAIVEKDGAQTTLKKDPSIKTTVKLRMIAQNQQLLRADFEQAPSDEVLAQCLDDFATAVKDCDAVILSDYGKGGLTHVQSMITLAREQNVPVLVDPKGHDYSRYRGASLITPNMKEFEAVVGKCRSDKEFNHKATSLVTELQLDALLVTRSEKGMTLFTQQGGRIDSPAKALEVYDVSGAGDTVISLMALVSVSGYSREQQLELANTVAGIVVGKLGTATATMKEVIEKLANTE